MIKVISYLLFNNIRYALVESRQKYNERKYVAYVNMNEWIPLKEDIIREHVVSKEQVI